MDKPPRARTTTTCTTYLHLQEGKRRVSRLPLGEHQQQEPQHPNTIPKLSGCKQYMGFLGTKGKQPVKRRVDQSGSASAGSDRLVSTSRADRDDKQEKLSKQTSEKLSKQSSENSLLATTTTSAATSAAVATWRRPRSVTSILSIRSHGRKDDKLLLPQNDEQPSEVAPYEEDSSDSCGQEWDLMMHVQQLSADDDDKSKDNKSKNNHCLVTPDMATAWVQMASQDTKTTEPKRSMATATSETTAATTTSAPTTLLAARRSAMELHLNEELDVDVPKNENTGTYTNKLARNLKGRSLLSSVTARVFRGQHRGDSTHHQHETTKTISQTQDCHLNCPRSKAEKTTTGLPQHHYHHQSYSVLGSASSVKSSIHDHTVVIVAISPTATTNTSSSTSSTSISDQSHRDNTSRRGPSATNVSRQSITTRSEAKSKTRMPPESKSVEGEGITMSPESSESSPTMAALTECAAAMTTNARIATSTATPTTTTEKPRNTNIQKSTKDDWKKAVDPKSGRTYYYHSITRETQWSMPIAMASDAERVAMEEKERRQRDFFALMESNILKSISSGAFNNSSSSITEATNTAPEATEGQSEAPKEIILTEALGRPPQALPRPVGGVHSIFSEGQSESKSEAPKEIVITEDCLGRPPQPLPRPAGLVRTISTMDESVLRALVQRVPSYRNLGVDGLQTSDELEISFAPQPNEGSGIGTKTNGVHGRNGNSANKLLSIQEALQNSWNEMDDKATTTTTTCQGMNHLSRNDSLRTSKHMATIGEKQRSMGTLLAGLPEGSNHNDNGGEDMYNGEMTMPRQCSFYGASMLDESYTQMGLTAEEFEAMQRLANMTDKIANVNDSDSDDNRPKLNPVEEGNDSSGSGCNYNKMHSSMGEFDFDFDDLDEDSQSSSIHLGNEHGTGRDPAISTTTAAASLPQDDDSRGSLSISTFDVSSSQQSVASVGSTPAETRPTTSRGVTPMPARARPVTARPMSQRKVTIVESLPGTKKPELQRRNTCGTLYVGGTMSEPDKDATIKCICGVYRAHILQAEMEEDGLDQVQAKYRIFNDLESHQKQKVAKKAYRPTVDFVVKSPPPLLDEITMFFRDVFRRAQMEPDCIIMSLIYVERLIKCTNGALRPRTCNWRSILFSCMVLSSKVWDDLSMWNADFSAVCPTGVEFTLQRINELEIAILSTLKYIVKVPASEYAKYYFLLRSMVIKSGLGGDDLRAMNPLDVQGAKRLQHMSSRYQSTAASKSGIERGKAGQRSKSIGSTDKAKMQAAANAVSLEHVIEM